MRSFVKSYGRRIALGGIGLATSGLLFGGFGTATYDLSSVTSTFTDQVSNAVTVALPIGAAIMALFIGWRVLRRIAKG